MASLPFLPWKSWCPQCNSDDAVYVYDTGIKFLVRLLMFNNRFACLNCNITWRRKSPFHTLRLHSKKPGSQHTRLFIKDN